MRRRLIGAPDVWYGRKAPIRRQPNCGCGFCMPTSATGKGERALPFVFESDAASFAQVRDQAVVDRCISYLAKADKDYGARVEKAVKAVKAKK
jgi:hypothetical protein